MIIAKFGGTSVNTKDRIISLCQIVEKEFDKKPVVVVSALRGVTDLLLSLPSLPAYQTKKELAVLKKMHTSLALEMFKDLQTQKAFQQYINSQINSISLLLKQKNINKASLDKLVSFGEIMSSYLISQALQSRGIKAQQMIATNFIITDNHFGSAEFLVKPTQQKIQKLLLPLINNKIIPVVTGFIAATKSGETTTLGRGGSDYTASILGFCLKASQIQIWTDVDGIFSSDPRFVKKAKLLPAVSFKEASELATFGARVLHPRTIYPAVSAGIPVKVLNTQNLKSPGTIIKNNVQLQGIVKAVSFKKKVVLINICSTAMLLQKGFLARVFKIFANYNISIDLVSVSEVSISLTLDNDGNLKHIVDEISQFAQIGIVENMGMVSLIGEGITSESKTISSMFDILKKEKIMIKMISLGATDINISLVISSKEIEKAVNALHNGLLLKH